MSDKQLTDKIFQKLLNNAIDITDTFDIDLGGLPQDVVKATKDSSPYILRLRAAMEEQALAPDVSLSQLEFGLIDMQQWTTVHGNIITQALEKGDVMAVDGTPLIHHQRFLTGQVYACAVGGLTSRNPMDLRARLIKVQADLSGEHESLDDVERVIDASEELTESGSWASAFLEYQEREYAYLSQINYLILDGSLITQNLLTRKEGRILFRKMLSEKNRRCYVGVVKNISQGQQERRFFARALKTGELYVQNSFYDFLKPRLDKGDYTGETKRFAEEIGVNVLRGVYKPGRKAFGFECHREDLPAIVSLLWLERNKQLGFEIPFLLAHVDAQIRARYRPSETMAAIEATLASYGEDEFFDETDERMWR